jgi:signal transduction histidine kinase
MMVIPQDLSRAILNIMNNACYAVWHKQQNTKNDYNPEISIKVSGDNKVLSIIVRDNGEGMTDEAKQKLYDNFFTTKPIGKGTGLGMGITRDIIENKHNGKITFDTKEGDYTCFELKIPIRLK